jgi:hypothetical protein
LVASASNWQAQVVELLNGFRVILGKPLQNYQPRSVCRLQISCFGEFIAGRCTTGLEAGPGMAI